jgi:hypothetical protein
MIEVAWIIAHMMHVSLQTKHVFFLSLMSLDLFYLLWRYPVLETETADVSFLAASVANGCGGRLTHLHQVLVCFRLIL